MDADTIIKKYSYLINKVRMMRAAQSYYQKYRCIQDFKRATRLEREVDSIIKKEIKYRQLGKEIF